LKQEGRRVLCVMYIVCGQTEMFDAIANRFCNYSWQPMDGCKHKIWRWNDKDNIGATCTLYRLL